MSLNLIVVGAVGGALYAITGFLKSRERFSFVKLGRTILLGALVGVFNSLLGLPVEESGIAMLTSSGEVAVIENLAKTISRRVF